MPSRSWTIALAVAATLISASVVFARTQQSSRPEGRSVSTTTDHVQAQPGSETGATPRVAIGSEGAEGIKPVQRGLLVNHKLPRRAFWEVIDGMVVNVGWAELQPTRLGPIATDNPIDQAITQVRQLRAAGGPSLTIKLRVLGGIWAPQWAKELGGSPITVTDNRSRDSGSRGETGTVGRFWTAAYGRAYQDLQSKLAARYEHVPELLQTTITRCTTFYGEPLLRQAGASGVAGPLYAAGYSIAADQRCQREQIDAHQVWTSTRSGLALNPYQHIRPNGSFQSDVGFTMQMMTYCRQRLGPRCVLENHSIRSPLQAGPYTTMYAAIGQHGPPVSYQTAAPQRIGDWRQTLAWAVDAGANNVELNRRYPTYDIDHLRHVGRELRANGT